MKLSALPSLLLLVVAPFAAAKDSLTVYTYDSFVSEWGPGPQLETLFEQQCACDLEFIAAEDGVALLNRLRIEGSKTKADIVLGIDDALIEEARNAGLVQSHQVDTSSLRSELSWQDEQFVPFDFGYFAFIYNRESVAEPATSLKELIESDASVIYQDPRTSTPGQGLMMWVNAVYGDDSADAWEALSGHTITVTKGWWEAYSMFLEGAADYVLSYTTSPAYHVVAEEDNRYLAAEFAEGHVAQVEVAAISQYSKQTKLANEFLQFLISQPAQEILPVTNWMLPVIDGVELPQAFDTLVAPKRIGFDSEIIAERRQDWLKVWRNAASN